MISSSVVRISYLCWLEILRRILGNRPVWRTCPKSRNWWWCPVLVARGHASTCPEFAPKGFRLGATRCTAMQKGKVWKRVRSGYLRLVTSQCSPVQMFQIRFVIGRSPVQVRASAPEFPTCFFSISSLFRFLNPPKTREHLGTLLRSARNNLETKERTKTRHARRAVSLQSRPLDDNQPG